MSKHPAENELEPGQSLIANEVMSSEGRWITVGAELPVKTLGRDQGVPSVQVHRIVQDAHGLLWFVGPSGLSRYDGSRVTAYGRKDGLSIQGLRTLTAGADGRLWIGTDLGVDVMESDGRIHAAFGPEWQFGFAERIVAQSDTVWFGASQGLYRWSHTTGLQADPDPRFHGALVSALMADQVGRVWAGGPQFGLLCLEHGVWQAPKQAGWLEVGAVQVLTLGPNGSILVGGERGAVQLLPDGSVLRRLEPVGGPVTAMLGLEDELWLGVGGELRRYQAREGIWRLFDIVLHRTQVNDLIADAVGNLWVATDNRAVIKVSALRHALLRPKLPDGGAVFSVRQTARGDVLLGGERSSWRLRCDPHDRNTLHARRIEGLQGHKVWDVLEDRSRRLWAATQTGLFRFENQLGMPEKIGAEDAVLGSPNRVLLERQDGLWVGTVRGLSVVRSDEHGQVSAREISDPDGQPLGYVYTIVEDHTGRLWLGSVGNGLWRETRRGLERVLVAGLQAKTNVYSITPRRDGTLAILENDRVILLDADGDGRVLVRSEDALAGWSAQFLSNERLIIGSPTGLRELDARNGLERRHVRAWLGLSGWEFTTSRSLSHDEHGCLWCGLNSGAMLVNLEALERVADAPTVKLGAVGWTNASPTRHGDVITVESGKWTMSAHFYAAWFVDEDDLRFRHRLLGFDSDWSEPSPRAEAQYNSLPRGEYTLEVQAYSPLTGWGRIVRLLTLRVHQQRRNSALRTAREFVRHTLDENAKLREHNHALEQRVREHALQAAQATETIQSLNWRLERSATTDALTGVANERCFLETLTREVKRVRRSRQPLSLIHLEIDQFSAYIEAYGEVESHQCLRRVASVLAEAMRDSADLVARREAESFGIILPAANADDALRIAERLRRIIEIQHLPHRASNVKATVTISLGVTTLEPNAKATSDDLLTQAEEALGRARTEGGNRAIGFQQATAS